jgi:hypothetical protein
VHPKRKKEGKLVKNTVASCKLRWRTASIPTTPSNQVASVTSDFFYIKFDSLSYVIFYANIIFNNSLSLELLIA